MGRWRKSRTQKSAQSPWNPFNIGSGLIRQRNGSRRLHFVLSPLQQKAKQINEKVYKQKKSKGLVSIECVTRLKVRHLSFCSPEHLNAVGPARAMATVVSSFGSHWNFLFNFLFKSKQVNQWVTGRCRPAAKVCTWTLPSCRASRAVSRSANCWRSDRRPKSTRAQIETMVKPFITFILIWSLD
jgi:hypothetical protein